MKKIIFTFLILIFCCCGEKKESSTASDNIQNDFLETVSDETVDTKNNMTTVDEKNMEDLGFALMYSETLNELKLGLTKIQVETILGFPDEVSLNEIWVLTGNIIKCICIKNLELNLI
jgi:hypothetical protein